MILLLILLTIVLILGILLFTVKSKILFHLDTTSSEANVTLLWLYPFLRSVVSSENNQLVLNVYLFNKRVYRRLIIPGNQANANQDSGSRNLIRDLHPTDININAQYGFRDPFVTGLVCSAVSMIAQFLSVESLDQNPDFLTFDDYISIDGNAELNLGRSLIKLV